MTAGVFAEISRDETAIIIAVTGEDWEISNAANALRLITPTLRKTDPPSGMLMCSATWAAVTQLAMTFNGSEMTGKWMPGERLQKWIIKEFTWRHVPVAVTPSWPDGLTPRPYQLENARMIGSAGSFMLFDDPGTGKTAGVILGLKVRLLTGTPLWPAVILTPSWEVADVWAREIATWAPEWPEPARYGGTGRAEKLGADILLTTYSTARIDAEDAAGPLVKLRAKTVIADECVPFNTIISTKSGERRICDVRPGDLVRGVDHASGRITWTSVHHVIRSPLRPLVRLPGLSLTPEHPVWMSDSGSLCYSEEHAKTASGDNLRPLRHPGNNDPVEPLEASFLFSTMRCTVGAISPRDKNSQAELSCVQRSSEKELSQGASSRRSWIPVFGSEPVPEPGGPGKGARHTGEPGLAPVERRQRHGAYYPAGEIARTARLSLGAGAGYPHGHGQGERLPGLLQGGHREPADENSDRGTWQRSRQERERPGPEEESPPGITGLDGSLDLERADPERSLWNLETGTGNYFANGILVHNCHLLKNSQARRTGAAQRIASRASTFVALSGTPVTRDTGDILPVLAAMDPQSYPAPKRFAKRYLQTSENGYGEVIEGLIPLMELEFRMALQGQYHRFAKEDVLSQLPPKVYSVRNVELPPEWRKAYKGLEEEMLAELPDGEELPVMSTLAQVTRLSQLASSAFDVEITEELNETTQLPVKHYAVTLKTPSWKVDALLGILAERPGDPVAVFANSAQLITIAGEECRKAGYKCGFITGGQGKTSRREAIFDFQAGKLDAILCTAGAGGLGITLTAAGTVVMLQRSWELDKSLQPEDRASRIGQEHAFVEIIDVVAKDTVDSRVRALTRYKGAQLAHLVRDPRIVRELFGGIR